jgi:hypothetical protein
MEYGSSIILIYGGVFCVVCVFLVALGIHNMMKEKHERDKQEKAFWCF